MTNKIYDNMKSNLTQSELKDQFDYDAENGWLIRKKNRYGNPYNKPSGHRPTNNGYGQLMVNRTSYLTHRLIWLYHYGEFPDEFIDHIDGNRSNNRIDNLRLVDSKMNNHNAKINKNNKYGFSNVSWHTKKRKYRVDINRKHIGYYKTLEEAILVAKKAKIEYHPTSPDAKKYSKELGIPLLSYKEDMVRENVIKEQSKLKSKFLKK